MADVKVCSYEDEVLSAIREKKKFILSTLDLSATNMVDDGAKYLSDALKNNSTLRYLNLDSNNISSAGAKYL